MVMSLWPRLLAHPVGLVYNQSTRQLEIFLTRGYTVRCASGDIYLQFPIQVCFFSALQKNYSFPTFTRSLWFPFANLTYRVSR